MTSLVKPITLLALTALMACGRPVPTAEELVAQCEIEVAPAGTYEYEKGQAVPVMRAVKDGTEPGARAFNACIRTKAAESGLIPLRSSTGHTGQACPDGVNTLYGGTTYCVGT